MVQDHAASGEGLVEGGEAHGEILSEVAAELPNRLHYIKRLMLCQIGFPNGPIAEAIEAAYSNELSTLTPATALSGQGTSQ